ncbi:hypothetical protein LCI18_006545 [Fusarium solani-melongenae]|uniref:Uncharacterized protein n=1 Tax=Fusarium solani subsp. cucurbitae TaxID=2747967 RepID=A0ACD3Z329_FUSSC|nr:hypothetical protein LCI18_006545 [Fusarium solani-melongenae]
MVRSEDERTVFQPFLKHKNDEWHNYAALTAAAYARDLLGIVKPQKVASQPAWAGKIESLLGNFCEDVREVLHHERSKEEEKLWQWVSPIDHFKTHTDKSRSRNRENRAGQWLLDSPDFKEFLSENNKNLFCPGIPGAGKTVLASVVIEYLLKLRKTGEGNERNRIGVAFIYFDFKQQSELVHFLGSILRQLATDDSSAFDSIEKAHKECAEKCRALSISEVRELLHSVALNFSRLFIVVDALDEGQQHVCNGLLSEIFDLQRSCVTNVFATSRHIPAIEARFKGASTLEIRACDEDVRKYVDDNIDRLPGFVQENSGLREEIKDGIINAVDGIFLLAKFHLDSLIGVQSVRALRDALDRLPSPAGTNAYDQAYDLALDRIESQIPNTRDFAIKVLSWVACARVHLTIKELQCALAVIVGSTHFDESNIPDMRDLVLVCAGLVVIDEERQIVRLVHYTAQEYFERHQKQRLPDAHSYITTICLAYLSLDYFQDVDLTSNIILLQQHPFYQYGAINWGYHAREAPALLPVILEFLQSEMKIARVGYVMARSVRGYTPRLPRVTGLHVAAFFGILEAVKLLMHHDCADSKDGHGWSPLSWAAFSGQYDVVAQLLEKCKVSVDSRDDRSNTPLHLATQNGHSEVMKLLLIKGHGDVNARDGRGATPLHLAAEKGHSAVPILLNHGADSNACDDNLRKPITLAVRGDHITTMRQLLDKNKVGLDSLDEHGHGPLLADAASAGSMAEVKVLIDEYKVDINSKDRYGRTPLSNALLNRHKDVANSLLSYDRVDLISPDVDGRYRKIRPDDSLYYTESVFEAPILCEYSILMPNLASLTGTSRC